MDAAGQVRARHECRHRFAAICDPHGAETHESERVGRRYFDTNSVAVHRSRKRTSTEFGGKRMANKTRIMTNFGRQQKVDLCCETQEIGTAKSHIDGLNRARSASQIAERNFLFRHEVK